jgi:hypothetical protein
MHVLELVMRFNKHLASAELGWGIGCASFRRRGVPRGVLVGEFATDSRPCSLPLRAWRALNELDLVSVSLTAGEMPDEVSMVVDVPSASRLRAASALSALTALGLAVNV